jgi:hypothetical protein
VPPGGATGQKPVCDENHRIGIRVALISVWDMTKRSTIFRLLLVCIGCLAFATVVALIIQAFTS